MQETKISCIAAILLWNSSPVIPVQTTCIIHIKQDLDGEKSLKGTGQTKATAMQRCAPQKQNFKTLIRMEKEKSRPPDVHMGL